MDAIIYGGGPTRKQDFEDITTSLASLRTPYDIIAANHHAYMDGVRFDFIAFLDGLDIKQAKHLREAIDKTPSAITISSDDSTNQADVLIKDRRGKDIFDSGQLAVYYALKNGYEDVYLCGIDYRKGTPFHESCFDKWGKFLIGLGDDIQKIRFKDRV